MSQSIYYLPGHGGRLETGLGEALISRGFEVVGRETVGEFRNFGFQEQIDIIVQDLTSLHWHEGAYIIANSFGAYLFLHAQAQVAPYIGKVLLLSPIVGEFGNEETRMNFIPPRSGRLQELAQSNQYPVPNHCEIHVGEQDWQSNPKNVLALADRLGLSVKVVPNTGHMLGKSYVSAVLDKWLPYAC